MNCNCTARHVWSADKGGQCTLQAANDNGLCDACDIICRIGGDCAPASKAEPADLGSGAAHEPIRPIDQERTAEDVQKATEDLIG